MSRKIDPAKRESIMESARSLFKERGVEETTIAEIAAGAGVATGTVYLYFDSKSKIVDSLCDYYLLDHMKAVAPYLKDPDIRSCINKAIHAALMHASKNADLVRLIDLRRSSGYKINRPEADRVVIRTLTAFINQHIDEGSVLPYNAVVLAELVSGIIEWISRVCFVWSDVDPMRYEKTLVDLLNRSVLTQHEKGAEVINRNK